MELFKTQSPLAETPNLPVVYMAIADPDGSAEFVDLSWCKFRPMTRFSDLVTVYEDEVIVVTVPDTDANAAKVSLVCDNSGATGVSVIWVQGATSYSPSHRIERAFWNVKSVAFQDWRLEAEESARAAELERRASLSSDELKLLDAAKADGSFKKFDDSSIDTVPTKRPEPVEVEDTPQEISF